MTYQELMAKLAKGEGLTAEEYQELGKVTRPTERFNEISGKKSELESQLKAKDDEIAKLKAEASEAAQKVDDELNTRLGELSGKNEELATELANLKIANQRNETLLKVNDLARKNELGVVFKNPDYLAYRVEKEGIDLNDAEKVKTFLTGIKDNEPEMCAVPVKSGAGTGNGGSDGGDANTAKPTSKWSDAEKADYIKTNGYDAYQELRKSESK